MKKHFLILLFLIFYFITISYKFIQTPTPFYDWDESIYAQVGREMINAKSLIPLWQGQFWLDKPPLVPLAYGFVESIFPVSPEISTRIFTLLLAIIILGLIYVLYYRLTKNIAISTLTVIITSFTSIFLQRTQVLNVDVFLLLGWLGYVVFFENFWLSLFFLGIGVLSKSLLGFYPLIGFFCLLTGQLYLKQIKFEEYKNQIKKLAIQGTVFLFWYAIMFAIFKIPFIQAHFLDSHLKRVTASIESHFGKRTFYIELLIEQLGNIVYLGSIGLLILLISAWKKKNIKMVILGLFFVPWFLFLNLTKTKIHWYLYPVLAQFAFLSMYPLKLFNKKYLLLVIITLIFGGVIIYQNLIKGNFFSTHYSQYDQYYNLSIYARNNCNQLNILVDKDSRNTHDTLKDMNLLIGTSEWWGNHPSIVYYSNKKVNFIYEIEKFKDLFNINSSKDCFFIDKNDEQSQILGKFTVKKKFNDMYLIGKL